MKPDKKNFIPIRFISASILIIAGVFGIFGNIHEAYADQQIKTAGTVTSAADTASNLSCSANAWSAEGATLQADLATLDNSEAFITAATFDSPDISEKLSLSNFGFDIPEDATIDGITLDVYRRSDGGTDGVGTSSQISLSTTAGTPASRNKASLDSPTNWPTSVTQQTYGGASDLWAATSTFSDETINGTGFGVVICAQANATNADIWIDLVQVAVGYTPGVGKFNQRAYIFKNDDGGGPNGLASTTNQAATSTARTNVLRGERMLVGFNIDNSGTAASTSALRLQYENQTDAADTWVDVGTTTEIQISNASTTVSGMIVATTSAPLVDSQCAVSGGNYLAGRFYSNTGTTSALKISKNSCLDLVFSVKTSNATLGSTYRLRLVEAATTSTDVFTGSGGLYVQFPTFTIASAESIQFSKGAFGTTTITIIPETKFVSDDLSMAMDSNGYPIVASFDTAGADSLVVLTCQDLQCITKLAENRFTFATDQGRENSIAIGSDGFPIVSARDGSTTRRLDIIACRDRLCSDTDDIITQISSGSDGIGSQTSLAIGSDGFPVIAHRNSTGNNLMVTKCNDIICTKNQTTAVTSDASFTSTGNASIAIGVDGFPIVAYDNTSNLLAVLACNDKSCIGANEEKNTISFASDNIGDTPSLVIGPDNFPIIAHQNFTNRTLMVTKCYDTACQGSDTTTTEITYNALAIGNTPSIALYGENNLPIIAHRAQNNTIGSSTLLVTLCNDGACTGGDETTVEIFNQLDVPYYESIGIVPTIRIAPDGFPIIYQQATSTDPGTRWLMTKCNSFDCDNAASSSNANLSAATTSPLNFFLDKQEYTNATSSDDIYASMAAASSSIAFQWVTKNTNNTDEITYAWEGHVSESQDLKLQIYRFGSTNEWYGTSTLSAPTVNTDYYLASTTNENLSEYYDGSNRVHARIVMATTTDYSTLYTDSASTTFASVSAAFNGTISSAFSPTHEYNGTSSTTPLITLTEDEGDSLGFTTGNDIRIAIATSTVDMRWNTSITAPTFGGTGSGNVAATVSYEDSAAGSSSVVVIDVTTAFSANQTLTISGLQFNSFGLGFLNSAASALRLFKDGITDAASDASDDKTVTIKGKVTLANNDGGVETNKFTSSSLADGELFSFKLTNTAEQMVEDKIIFTTTSSGLESSDFADLQLIADYDGDGTVDAPLEAGEFGAGTISITGQAGTIAFSGTPTTTPSWNYILTGDISSLQPGDELTVSLLKADIHTTGTTSVASTTVSGTASSVNHIRSGGGTVGGGGSTGGGVTGASTVTGGGSGGGGESLTVSPGFKAPTAVGTASNLWTSGSNGIISDNLYASETTLQEGLNFNNFNFSVPSTDTIVGIEVTIEASASTAAGTIAVALDWNNDVVDVSTTTQKTSSTLTTTDTIYTFGGSSDTWGRTWTASTEFTDAKFSVEVSANPSGGNTLQIDAITVKVHSQATGGGGGGGGRSEIPRKVLTQFASVIKGLEDLVDELLKLVR